MTLYLPLMWEMHVLDQNGNWVPLRPIVPPGAPPYRYDYEKDARAMLDRLYPDIPAINKRVVRV